MKKEVDKLQIILFGAIIILLFVAGYEYNSIIKFKKEIMELTTEVNRLNGQLTNTQNQLGQISKDKADLDSKYQLLVKDVAEIYRGCMKDNACKGRYPQVSWYCNNVGDEVSDPSHLCTCDPSCNLVTKQI